MDVYLLLEAVSARLKVRFLVREFGTAAITATAYRSRVGTFRV